MKQPYLNWKQTDPRWNQREAWPASRFSDAQYHYFRDCGCLVCALAVMLRHFDIEKEDDESRFNPWVLNQRLIDCGAINSAADLELSRVERLYPLQYLGAVPYSREALAQAAEKGLLCLVAVPGEKADRHFTALISVLPDDAVVFDPVCGEMRLCAYDEICELRFFSSMEKQRSHAAIAPSDEPGR